MSGLAIDDIVLASIRARSGHSQAADGASPSVHGSTSEHDAALPPPHGYERFLMSGAEQYLRWLRAAARDPRDDQAGGPFVASSSLIDD
jgi:hypothetical protein